MKGQLCRCLTLILQKCSGKGNRISRVLKLIYFVNSALVGYSLASCSCDVTLKSGVLDCNFSFASVARTDDRDQYPRTAGALHRFKWVWWTCRL